MEKRAAKSYVRKELAAMSLQWIQQAINYMEQHICEDIHYDDVAKHVHMSNYNFHRTFSLVVGMTANEYIRSRRLTLAAQELQTTDLSVIDAALKYGYESPESFSKAFSRFHGSSPKQAKQNGARLHLFNPLVIKITLEGGSIMEYRMEHRKQQQFIARVMAFPSEIINDDNDHSISDFWAACYDKNLIVPMQQLRAEGKKDLYGLCGPTRENETHFNCGIGVLVDEDTDMEGVQRLLEDGYVMWQTEPADYAVFQCMGTDGDCISETWGKFYKEFLTQTSYEQTEDTDYELYYEKGESGLFCELWIPVRKTN